MSHVTRAPARLFASYARVLPASSLLTFGALGLGGCYGSHTADEPLLYEAEDVGEDDDARDGGVRGDAGRDSGQSASDDPCGDIADSDVIGQIFCDFTNNSNGGSLVGGNSCRGVAADDLLGQGLCLLGGGSSGGGQLGGALQLLDLLGTLGDLTGGGNGQTGGLEDILGLLGGGGTGSQQGGLDLGAILGQLGGDTGNTNGNANQQPDLGALLDLLGGLQGNGQQRAVEAPGER